MFFANFSNNVFVCQSVSVGDISGIALSVGLGAVDLE